ncbi:processed acidic surface protein [Litchfieldia alkalitelluris]|uniref:processed acidic surface protein n=1 Tax=Litchfieldia alkalitelluris TaxID=304268 RepID=UPI000997D906|nr:processed acidic surface protein [Litchfieldia alkalitelluris]
MGWTVEELESYLEYYELTLNDFSTIEELEDFLGTPITDENLAQLLLDYDMSRAELDELLAGFGETVDDYWFIEELDVSIDFYLNHDEYMKEAEDILATMGLTEEEEVDRFFNHLMVLDETVLEEQMASVSSRLEPYLAMNPEEELTSEQIQELSGIWSEMMTLLNLNPKYYLIDETDTRREVNFAELLAMETLNGESVFLELYDQTGELILDMQLSEDMLTSDFIFEGAEQLSEVGELAGELTNIKHEQLPNPASPFLLNIVLGMIVLLTGFIIPRKKVSI